MNMWVKTIERHHNRTHHLLDWSLLGGSRNKAIKKSFSKGSLQDSTSHHSCDVSDFDYDQEDNVPLEVLSMDRQHFGCEF